MSHTGKTALAQCRKHGCEVILIDSEYRADLPN